jgi:hypothetical protein
MEQVFENKCFVIDGLAAVVENIVVGGIAHR